ncbi:MAG: hypothetical protein RLZZ200_1617 [Pseudomonadota bacterium]
MRQSGDRSGEGDNDRLMQGVQEEEAEQGVEAEAQAECQPLPLPSDLMSCRAHG